MSRRLYRSIGGPYNRKRTKLRGASAATCYIPIGRMPPSKNLSIVVPVFNSSESLQELTQRLLCVLEREDLEGEVIFVNDASRDNSWDRIVELAARYPAVRGINLMRNYGQHN